MVRLTISPLPRLQDPFFEEIKTTGRNGQVKIKKQKKGTPPGLSRHDGDILMAVRRRAYWLDLSLFNLCGIRFGWSAIIGLFPGVGDAIDAMMAYLLVYRKAIQVDGGLPAALQSRMLLNIALDFGIGIVPFLGDIADAWFKANTRNAWLLEEYLLTKAEAQRRGDGSVDRGAKHVLDAEDLNAAGVGGDGGSVGPVGGAPPAPSAGSTRVPAAAKVKKSRFGFGSGSGTGTGTGAGTGAGTSIGTGNGNGNGNGGHGSRSVGHDNLDADVEMGVVDGPRR
ncbi:hypothetical protein BD289DRAFT_365032 [Coniella lustricola]|uniref:PH domain-containing protein n=1 Tax=Coniella lustricola TaxID=2025994 RepID=A0A2T3ACX5_9PEZI|nr:hypothetical protein BD289DRAFT_365032 [Coniella lustricola]